MTKTELNEKIINYLVKNPEAYYYINAIAWKQILMNDFMKDANERLLKERQLKQVDDFAEQLGAMVDLV